MTDFDPKQFKRDVKTIVDYNFRDEDVDFTRQRDMGEDTTGHVFHVLERLSEFDMEFTQEWRRVGYDRYGNLWLRLTSSWYDEEEIARSLLNNEYPEPTPAFDDGTGGFRFVLETRWVTKPKEV